MMKSTLFGVAAMAVTAMTVPASAQQVVSNPGYCAQFYPNANCQNRGENNPYTGDYQRRGGTSGQLGFSNRGFYESRGELQPQRRVKRSRSYSDNGRIRRTY